MREFDDNRRTSVTEDTLHCEEPVNLFWTRTASLELAAIKRALVPSGQLYLFYEPPSAGRAGDIAERVVPRLDAAGFGTQVVTGGTGQGASLLALIADEVT